MGWNLEETVVTPIKKYHCSTLKYKVNSPKKRTIYGTQETTAGNKKEILPVQTYEIQQK